MEQKYLGMTVNERLYVGGFLEDFKKAISESNLEKAVEILRDVELTDESIKPILEKYGLEAT